MYQEKIEALNLLLQQIGFAVIVAVAIYFWIRRHFG